MGGISGPSGAQYAGNRDSRDGRRSNTGLDPAASAPVGSGGASTKSSSDASGTGGGGGGGLLFKVNRDTKKVVIDEPPPDAKKVVIESPPDAKRVVIEPPPDAQKVVIEPPPNTQKVVIAPPPDKSIGASEDGRREKGSNAPLGSSAEPTPQSPVPPVSSQEKTSPLLKQDSKPEADSGTGKLEIKVPGLESKQSEGTESPQSKPAVPTQSNTGAQTNPKKIQDLGSSSSAKPSEKRHLIAYKPTDPGAHNNYLDRHYQVKFLQQFQNFPSCTEKPVGLRLDEFVEAALSESEANRASARKRGGGGEWMSGKGDKRGARLMGSRKPRSKRGGFSGGRGGASAPKASYASGSKAVAGSLIRGRVEKLVVGASAWRPNRGASSKSSGDEEAKRALAVKTVRGLINKISESNYESLRDKILAVDVFDRETLEAVAEVVFDKAVVDNTFASIYAKLCFDITEHDDFGPPDLYEDNKRVDFKRVIIQRTQKEFVLKNTKVVQADEDALKREKELGRPFTEAEKTEVFEAVTKLKRRMLGTILFIGELYKVKLLTSKIISSCIQEILQANLNKEEVPKEDDMDCLLRFLTSVGPHIDDPKNANRFKDRNAYFDSVAILSKDKRLPSRTRFLLEDLHALRQAGWNSDKISKKKTGKASAKRPSRGSSQDARSSLRGRGSPNRGKVPGSPASPRSPSFGRGTAIADKTKSGEASPSWQQKTTPGRPGANSGAVSSRPSKTRDELDQMTEALLDEYFVILEIEEAVDCVKDLAKVAYPGYYPAFVEFCVKSTLEKGVKQVGEFAKLLTHLIREGLIPASAVETGLKNVLTEIADIKVDVPKAPEYISDIIAHLVLAKPYEVVKKSKPVQSRRGRGGRGRGSVPEEPAETVLVPVLDISSIVRSVAVLPGTAAGNPDSAPEHSLSGDVLAAISRRNGLTGLRAFVDRGGVVVSDLPVTSTKNSFLKSLRAPTSDPTWFKKCGISLAFPVESGLIDDMRKAMETRSVISMLDWIDENVQPEELVQDPAFLRVLVRCGLSTLLDETKDVGDDYGSHLTDPEKMAPWKRLIAELRFDEDFCDEEILDEAMSVCSEVTRAGLHGAKRGGGQTDVVDPDQDLLLFKEVLARVLLSGGGDEGHAVSGSNAIEWWSEAKQAKNIGRWTHVDAFLEKLSVEVEDVNGKDEV